MLPTNAGLCIRARLRRFVALGLIGLLSPAYPSSGQTLPNVVAPATKPSSETRRVTFIQMAAPHLFDAGIDDRHGAGVEEEALDNRAALHWAILETNRLILAEHRTIDFVVITGGFGLQNVQFEPTDSPAKKCSCPKRFPGKEGPTEAVSLKSAVSEVAEELEALEVGKVYLVPGADDLCDESPTDLHRWAAFVFRLNEELLKRHKKRIETLDVVGHFIFFYFCQEAFLIRGVVVDDFLNWPVDRPSGREKAPDAHSSPPNRVAR